MPPLVNLAGKTFGMWTVLRRDGIDPGGKPLWLCQCGCGVERPVSGSNLRQGISTGCGCAHGDSSRKLGPHERHGLGGTSEYRIWKNMLSRCHNPRVPHYRHYGGRGIVVCDRWRGSFVAFYADMGPRPSPRHTIDRQNNDGNYEPGNCRWVTMAVQAFNRRNTRRITYNGETLLLREWAARAGLREGTLVQRIYGSGWPVEEALTKPSRKQRRITG